MLLPKISMGISLGLLVTIYIGVCVYSSEIIGGGLILFVLMVTIPVSIYLTQKYEALCSLVRLSLVSGLVLAVSIDLFIGGGFLAVLSAVLRIKESKNLCYSKCMVPEIILLWTIVSVLTFAYQASVNMTFSLWSRRGQYVPLTTKPSSAPKLATQQKTFSYPDTLEFNYFDLDNLPDQLQSYADLTFTTVQALSKSYGFQVDNSRNQAEHLLMLLSNEQRRNDQLLVDPCQRLHSRMFHNYKKWCERMGSRQHFIKHSTGKKYACLIEDMLLFLLIWGESANMRHMPESLCFLYHKLMEEHIVNTSTKKKVSAYPGFFLDMVVTPIYDVIIANSRNSGDHNNKKTYDDFNEFFWSPNCLQYDLIESSNDDYIESSLTGVAVGSHVAVAMKAASKTYVEKRSWLHPLLSMHRIFEWHVITFSLLSTWSFSGFLVWTYTFTIRVGSFVFWEITFLSIIWTCLEVWSLYPNAIIPGPSVYGYLLRIMAGYLVLVYQTIYFCWAFSGDSGNPTGSKLTHFHSYGDANFWWWQYIWLSLLTTFFYFLQSVLAFFPSVNNAILTFKNELFQAVLQICYPTAQLYVGKELHVPQRDVVKYILFWLSLILFKLWFGYRYIVFPVTIPSLELYDDYMNFAEIKFVKTAMLIFVWWFPHFMVYIIDLSIWYSMWSSIVGGFIALVDRQGAVRDAESLRSHFMRSPLAFCTKLMPYSANLEMADLKSSVSTVSLTAVNIRSANPKPYQESKLRGAVEMTNMNSNPFGMNKKSLSSADLQRYQLDSSDRVQPAQAVDGTADDLLSPEGDLSSGMQSFLDVRNERWIIFAKVWNEIIDRLRLTDHLNDAEREMLVFSSFNFLSKPVYLPIYQTAGCLEMAVHTYKDAAAEYLNEHDPMKKMLVIENLHAGLSVNAVEACNEAWEYATWLIKLTLGHVHSIDCVSVISCFDAWIDNGDFYDCFDFQALPDILNVMGNIAATLKSSLAKRKKAPIVTPAVLKKVKENEVGKVEETSRPANGSGGKAIKKSVSTGFLAALETNAQEVDSASGADGKDKAKFAKLQPFRKDLVVADTTRDKLRDDIRNLLNLLRNALRVKPLTASGQDLISRITFILLMENGFLWNDMYASLQIDELARDPNVHAVTKKLHALLKFRLHEAEISSPEASRRLYFFINSLFMDMPSIPATRFCKEYTCMTPFYSEDVLLSKEDLEAKNSDGISTILYLQTLYKKDWNNFLERMELQDEQHIWFPKNLQETRQWASLRAQTLYRTCEGMMYSEAAIRIMSEIERVNQKDEEVLSKLKFNYVIACQVYGQQRKNMESKADDIDFLLVRHPNLRVAYIDAVRVNREGDTAYYSVLIKHDPINNPNPTKANIKEVYRVKLPGNPVIGEGKPENQNHAIIFTRGRYLQAIDMNQDGYFEEALKMRNLLQEFDSGSAIIGFREHIFTGSVSSVANYMALQELSFVTLGQRVLNSPLRIRQHYGHPDVFDKMFVMTEGGMSKASRGINLSEDVFAGFNATIRGHNVDFKEYVQVGKGRDVGLQQTYKFEAKLSQGNAEQSLSRDMNRICDRLDFFRLMSFFYGGIGHYMANTMVMFTLVLVVYTMLSLAIYGEEGVNGRPMHPEGVLQLLLSGLGLLQTLPLAVTLIIEKGYFSMVQQISYMFLSGGPLYFIFHIQTKCYYFQQTLLAGGAMYRPTGRGFVIRHSPFDENFRFFASSHIYLGFELCIALVLFALYTTSKQYGGLTWSLWLTAISFMLGPFWFNPVTFEWNKLKEDYFSWLNWMAESCGPAEQSWDAWWREENLFYKRLSWSWKTFLVVQKSFLWIFVAYGLAGKRILRDSGEQTKVMEIIVLSLSYEAGNWIISKLEKSLTYAVRRFDTLSINSAFVVTLVYLFATHTLYLRFTVAMYYFVSSLSFLALVSGSTNVRFLYKYHDYVVGNTLFLLLFALTLLQIGYLQTWLLYHNALSTGVVIDDILKFARKSKEQALVVHEAELNVINELKVQMQEQEKLIRQLQQMAGYGYASDKTSLSEKEGLLIGAGKKVYGATDGAVGNSANIQDISTNLVSNMKFTKTIPIVAPLQKSAADKSVLKATSSYGSAGGSFNGGSSPINTIINATLATPVLVTAQAPKLVASNLSLVSQNSVESMGSEKSKGSKPSLSNKEANWDSFHGLDPKAAPSDFVFSQPTNLPPR